MSSPNTVSACDSAIVRVHFGVRSKLWCWSVSHSDSAEGGTQRAIHWDTRDHMSSPVALSLPSASMTPWRTNLHFSRVRSEPTQKQTIIRVGSQCSSQDKFDAVWSHVGTTILHMSFLAIASDRGVSSQTFTYSSVSRSCSLKQPIILSIRCIHIVQPGHAFRHPCQM
jgi:hypothetical protein